MSDFSPQQAPEKNHGDSLLSELLTFAFITLFIVVPIRMFVAQPFIVSGSSMDPTFENGQYLIIDEISYRFTEPKRGDVVVFRYPNDPTKFFIKRIIALPEETIVISGATVTITTTDNPEGFVLDEQYIERPMHSNTALTLGADEYFVMGDNRPASSDSRIWGALSKELIIGRALVRLLPISRIDAFPGEHVYETLPTTFTSSE